MRVLAVLAVLAACLYGATDAQTTRNFQQRSFSTIWSPRQKANVEFVKQRGTFTALVDDVSGRTQAFTPTSYFILYGGQSSSDTGLNDVWVASATGTTWQFVGGVNDYGLVHPTYGSTSFSPAIEVGHCQDNQFRQYRSGGQLQGRILNDVWSSADGFRWTLSTDVADWRPRFLHNMITDSNNALYVVGGILANSANPREDSNEVWRSTTQGRVWNQVPPMGGADKTPLGRGVAILLNSGSTWGTENNVLIWMTGVDTASLQPRNGDDPLSYLADIWASGDQGKNWNAVTLAATFGRRDDANAEITSGGLMVLAGGYAGTSTREVYNDIWVSANGGYSWGQCVQESEWEDRRYLMTVLDDAGYIWVMGGDVSGLGASNDVWRSTWSLNNNQDVAQRCKITIPSCGAGLRCQPGQASTLVSTDGRNVYCNACPYNFGSTTAQTLVTAFLVIFLLGFLVTGGLLGYTYYKLRNAGAPSPIPLPGAAQRWWNKSTAGSVAGGATNETAAADTLYQPLRIRDQV